MNPTTILGGCLCGSTRYEAAATPFNITHCHCFDCRRANDAPFVTWASFPRSSFRFTTGEPRQLGCAGRLCSFCPNCGTPLTFLASPDATEIDITVCTFDHPAYISPADHTWTEDRLPWIHLADHLPTYEQNRPSQID